jgi:SAM-dependent methyltransferase
MRAPIARRLRELNRDFYDRFAGSFSESRTILSPGIRRALIRLAGSPSLLDLGCGDGRVGRALLEGRIGGGIARYVGLDFSAGLLERGRERLLPAHSPPPSFQLLQADLTARGWWKREGLEPPFSAALCLAVLHHLPGEEARGRFLRQVRPLLVPDAPLVLSVWQFLHLARLRRKVVPWAEAGFSPGEMDSGDLLVDWRRGGTGLRYVHHFSPGELERLCRAAGWDIHESFRSDGQSGDMGLYLVLRPRGRA